MSISAPLSDKGSIDSPHTVLLIKQSTTTCSPCSPRVNPLLPGDTPPSVSLTGEHPLLFPLPAPPRPPRPPHPPRPTPSSSRPAPPAHCGCCAPSLLPPRPFREAVFHAGATDHASKIHSTPGLPLLRTPGGVSGSLGQTSDPHPEHPDSPCVASACFLHRSPIPHSASGPLHGPLPLPSTRFSQRCAGLVALPSFRPQLGDPVLPSNKPRLTPPHLLIHLVAFLIVHSSLWCLGLLSLSSP